MGDRTFVSLTVPEACADKADQIIDDNHGWSTRDIFGFLLAYEFEEVNYGELPFLGEFRKAGIPYESRWERGGEYSAGEQSCRFTADGSVITKERDDDEVNPDLDLLFSSIDDHEALKKIIQERHDAVTVLPWENQVEYGKRYVMKQLLLPD